MTNRPSGLWKNLYNEVGYEANVPEEAALETMESVPAGSWDRGLRR